jgi:hypothetical protein
MTHLELSQSKQNVGGDARQRQQKACPAWLCAREALFFHAIASAAADIIRIFQEVVAAHRLASFLCGKQRSMPEAQCAIHVLHLIATWMQWHHADRHHNSLPPVNVWNAKHADREGEGQCTSKKEITPA